MPMFSKFRQLTPWAIAPLLLSFTVGILPVSAQGDDLQAITTLEQQARQYTQQGQTVLAQQSYREATILTLAIAENILATIIPVVGAEHPALDYAQEAFLFAQQSGDRQLTADCLNLIGRIQFANGATSNARYSHEEAIALLSPSGNPAEQRTIATATLHLGKIAQAIVNTSEATRLYNEALNTFQQLNDVDGEIQTRQAIADLLRQQRNYPAALESYRQALQLAQQTNDASAISDTLYAMAEIENRQRQYAEAQEFFQAALEVNQKGENIRQRGQILNRLGSLSLRFGDGNQAIALYQAALGFAQEAGDLTEQGSILRNLSIVYQIQGKYTESFDFLQQSALVYRQMGLRALEAEVLAEMGATQNVLGNRELAIIFYKQSVAVIESLREDLSVVSELDLGFTTRVFSPIYRRLGELLLDGDRLEEAQQALDLLKVQEIDEYTANVTPNETTRQAVDILPTEQAIVTKYEPLRDQAIALGKELLALRQIPLVALTPDQKQRIVEITGQQQQLTKEFNEFARSADVQNALKNISNTAREQNLNLSSLRRVTDNLRDLDDRTVILYPLVLDDRLELIIASPFAPPVRHTVKVSRAELDQTILAMREGLTTPRRDTYLEPARQLYDWLIAPIEADLQAAGATSIIYAPDDQLRYIPLAALHDGDRWLIERFRINNITAASLTDFTHRPDPTLSILAGAFTTGEYEVQAGNRAYELAGLPFARAEVDNIARIVPGTTTLFDGNFTKAQTVPQMDNFNVVHFATHAAFVPGKPENSFILFGNGDRITLEEVKDTWFLTNVDLIVLSACQTAVGGELGNGEEILGFGYLMQDAGARAAIASLWSVSDGGTQALMNHFYAALQKGGISKAEALRQAQIAMIKEKFTVGNETTGNTNHPYYWAAFILIGNAL